MTKMIHNLVPHPKRVRETGGDCAWADVRVERSLDGALAPEAYRLFITPHSVRMEASGEAGFFYAGKTLEQLRLLTGATCHCMEIEDEPDQRLRGYMLDISRCKVPRMEQLFRLVDLLAFFKYNQLQLYTEHTFAYKGHEEVWEGASPMTPEQMRELVAYGRERFIELVPNQNALGHMERWLRHEAYHPLAESPDGFHHPLMGWRPHGTVLYPCAESLRLVDGLLDQLLPCFDSEWIHLGCDEPWELGQGRSQERAEEEGRHAIFRDHVNALHGLAARRGKRLLFWSDELRGDPDRIHDFPKDIVPVVWGYEADHDFDAECEAYAKAGYDFIIAPGDSSWNSFTGRLDAAAVNIERAARAARRHEALGMLLTSWGDHGHQQVWPAQLPGILTFASAAWNLSAMGETSLEQALDDFVFRDPERALGQFWSDMARLDAHIPAKISQANSSFPYDALYAAKGRVRKALRPFDRDCLFQALHRLAEYEKELGRAAPACPDALWLLDESRLALEMTRYGLHRAEAIGKDQDVEAVFSGWEKCLRLYRKVWLRRNREGGLAESLGHLIDSAPPGHLRELPPEGPG